MKIGIIYCAYNCLKYAQESIAPFLNLRHLNLIHNISAVAVPFEEYRNVTCEEDGTVDFLLGLEKNGEVDRVFTEPKYIKEHFARDLCLQYLKTERCDAVWMVDGDELYTLDQINSIIDFIKTNDLHYWYSINFKNYIFDGQQWVDGFCPARIFKTSSSELQVDKFYWDNDLSYKNANYENVGYKQLNNLMIPKTIAHVKHMTWLHENGKVKYEYQMKHFGNCGYEWDYEKNELKFNKEFYLKTKQEIPTIYCEKI